jgi:predicted amidohydrolase YtcJ
MCQTPFKLVLAAALLAASAYCLADNKIIINANAWTGNPEQVWAQTIVVEGQRIVAVGDTTLALSYPEHNVIDAAGHLVLPGFIDNHTHFMDGSASLVGIKTQQAKSIQAFVDTVENYAADLPSGEWITGGLWDHEAWGGELPHRDWIDDVSADNPLLLLRVDGHMAIANSAVLQLAGITKDTPDPQGGVIVRDKDGQPTGMLKDNAMNLAWAVMPALTDSQTTKMFDAGTAEGLKNGVTQIHNMSNWDNIAIFERAKAQGRLKIRTYYFPHISFRQQLAQRIKTQGKGDNWLRFGGVKEMVDGSLGSTTAWFYDPYTDAPETSGFPLLKMTELRTSIKEAHNLGLQLAIHAIGDKANDEILSLFAELDLEGERPRIEHAQHLSSAAINKFAELGVVPSVHPYHAIDDGRWAGKRIGKARLAGTYAFKSLFDSNARVSFGSDWSVAPLNPIAGIYAAVTRRTLDGKNPLGWVPEQKISVAQAVTAYTINNAWAGKQEEDLGTIEPGKLADIVILSDNIFTIVAEDIINTRVTLTMIGGEVMYQLQ